MQFHQVKPEHKLKKSRRIGRGGKKGTTSGRGTKGQKARAGAKIRPAIRDIIKKLPKLRGVYFKSFRQKPAIVNLERIDKKFKDNQIVNPESLIKAGLVSKFRGRIPAIKILGGGKLSKKFSFSKLSLSKSAKEQILKAGGTIK